RDETRSANVSAHRAERAAARERDRTSDARRSAKKWRKKCKSAEKEYKRVTSNWVWRLYWPLDRMLHRARSIFHNRGKAGYSAVPTLHDNSLGEKDGHENEDITEFPTDPKTESRDFPAVPSREGA